MLHRTDQESLAALARMDDAALRALMDSHDTSGVVTTDSSSSDGDDAKSENSRTKASVAGGTDDLSRWRPWVTRAVDCDGTRRFIVRLPSLAACAHPWPSTTTTSLEVTIAATRRLVGPMTATSGGTLEPHAQWT